MVRFALFMMLALFAINFPDFGGILNLMGCIFSVILGFIFPYLLFNAYFKNKVSVKVRVFNTLILSLGVLGGILGIFATVRYG